MPGIAKSTILNYVLLGLVRHRAMYGYEMHQALEQPTALGLIWHVKQPNLYAYLAKLEGEGYLSSAAESNGGRPPRHMVTISQAGAAIFDYWLATPVHHGRDFRQEFLTQLYFAQQQGPQASMALIDRQTGACQIRCATLRGQHDRIEPARTYDRLVYAFRLRQMEMILDWLQECRDFVANPSPQR